MSVDSEAPRKGMFFLLVFENLFQFSNVFNFQMYLKKLSLIKTVVNQCPWNLKPREREELSLSLLFPRARAPPESCKYNLKKHKYNPGGCKCNLKKYKYNFEWIQIKSQKLQIQFIHKHIFYRSHPNLVYFNTNKTNKSSPPYKNIKIIII